MPFDLQSQSALKSSVRGGILAELAFISLGSNIDPEKYLPLAVHQLGKMGRVIEVSKVYQNPAIAHEPQADYLNAAVLIETERPPEDIRRMLREIEAQLDRVRTSDKYAPRTMDLDLCLYGDLQIELDDLQLPDPDILTRPHLARTLADLRPDYQIPGNHRTLEEIAQTLQPGSDLRERQDVVLLSGNPDKGSQDG